MAILENRVRKYSTKPRTRNFINAQFSITTTINFLAITFSLIFLINSNFLSIGKHLVEINGTTYTKIINPTKKFVEASIDTIVNIANFNNLHIENLKLKLDNKKLTNAISSSAQIRIENAKLMKALNIADPEATQNLKAKLVYHSSSDSDRLAIIGAGKNHGVTDNQIVISNGYLVGRIVTSGDNYSKVTLANTYNARIPVKTSNSRLKAILVGSSENGGYLLHLHSAEKPIEGELILTSGDGNYYPKDIPVAKVIKVTDENTYVHIFGDLSNIDLVEIVSTKDFK